MPTAATLRRTVAFLAALIVLGACDDGNAFPTTPTLPKANVEASLTRAIQSEYELEYTYLRVIADFGAVEPFDSILAEQPRHSSVLADLFQARDLATPASEWNLDNVLTYPSVPDACAAALGAERDNIEMYDELLKLNLPDDVLQAFADNRESSANERVPAFENCS